MIDSATALAFSMFENRGVYALILGSGVSRGSRIPTGWEITLDLARRLGHLEGVEDQADWAAWYQERFGKAPGYSDLLDALAQTPGERRALLHSYIEPTDEDREEGRRLPTPAHTSIARLVRDGYVRVMVTTNFDRLLESALRTEGIEPTVIRSDDDLAGAAPLPHARCYILKVHGDYLDTRLRNTAGELASYSPAQDALLDRILDEHGLIVCGWSSDWDAALRAAIIRAPSRRYPLFWASRADPGPSAKDIIAQRGGKVVRIDDADGFFVGLQQKLEAQAALQRPNPLSVELLVATLKKQLAKPEHRIALGETVEQEVRRVRKTLAGAAFAMNAQFTPETFRQRVFAYQALCEPMVRMAFTLGRWGDGPEFNLARDLMLSVSERPSGGSAPFLNLSTFPAVLSLWAYCLGAAKAERPDVILRMLHVPIHKEHRSTSEKAVECFVPEVWSAQDVALWQTFEGMARHYLPACDLLHPMFAEWLTDEFLTPKAFDLAWGWVEILSGLEFTAARTDKETLRTVLARAGNGRGYLPSPIGRMTYDSETGPRLFDRLSVPSVQTSLAAAGFADGDAEFIGVLQENLAVVVDQAGWR